MRSLADPFRIVHGSLRDAKATAFAIVKDEMFFMRSFFDHHRRIGVEQFIILDDHSTDGTREFLAAQPDCLVLESSFAFGEQVSMAATGGERRLRAGIAFKTLIPQTYLAGRYALYLDADELAILPAGVTTLGELNDILARNDVQCVAASFIDFFPGTVQELDPPRDFPTSEAMVGAHPYFDALPLIGWKAASTGLVELNENASSRLFRRYRVKAVPGSMMRAPRWLNRLMPYKYPTTTVSKMPIVRWDPGIVYEDSHRANVAPSPGVLVGIAHMKFTHDLTRRIDHALESRAYAHGSRKYQWYAELLEAMRNDDGSFLGADSRRYTGPADLARAGLTALDLN